VVYVVHFIGALSEESGLTPTRLETVLVTGGAGFIGTHLVNRLVGTGAKEVRVLDNFSRVGPSPIRSSFPRDKVTLVEGDIRDLRQLREAVQGCDTVFHLAAVATVASAESDPQETFETNVTGTFQVLREAHRAKVHRVVHASSREVYGDSPLLPVAEDFPLQPKNVYGHSKAASEQAARMGASSTDVLIVRLANVFGPGDHGRVVPRFIQSAFSNEPLTLNGGSQILDLIWIDDAVEMLIRAAGARGVDHPINIGSGSGITVRELATEVISLAKSKSQIMMAPSKDFEVRGFVADTKRAGAILNFTEPTSLRKGLKMMIGVNGLISGGPMKRPRQELRSYAAR
jgi:UDP-glucose 4-epimerase